MLYACSAAIIDLLSDSRATPAPLPYWFPLVSSPWICLALLACRLSFTVPPLIHSPSLEPRAGGILRSDNLGQDAGADMELVDC